MNDKLYSDIRSRLSDIEQEVKEFVIETLKEDGRISLGFQEGSDEAADESNYPVTATLYGKHDTPHIKLTDVYLSADNCVYADGIEDETGNKRTGFYIYPEQFVDIFSFMGHVTP